MTNNKQTDRLALGLRQNWRCILCGDGLLDRHRQLKEPVNIEHLWPQWAGGSSSAKTLSHTRCNKKKDFKMPTEEQMLRFVAWYAPSEIVNYYTKRGLLDDKV